MTETISSVYKILSSTLNDNFLHNSVIDCDQTCKEYCRSIMYEQIIEETINMNLNQISNLFHEIFKFIDKSTLIYEMLYLLWNNIIIFYCHSDTIEFEQFASKDVLTIHHLTLCKELNILYGEIPTICLQNTYSNKTKFDEIIKYKTKQFL